MEHPPKDTTVYPQSQNGFTATPHAIVWKEKGVPPQVRRLYYVSDDTAEWDIPGTRGGLRAGGKELCAMGSRLGYYCYIGTKMTGRKETKTPIGGMGYRYNITVNVGTPDEETLSAHITYHYWDNC